MKKKVLLLAGAAFLALGLSSYSDGPGNHASLNCTAAGGPGNCAGSGCHSPNNSNTTVQLTISNSIGGPQVTYYTPSVVYYVKLTGVNGSSMPGYGFQVAAVSGGNVQAGSFIIGSSTDQHTTPLISGLQLMENKRLIPYTTSPGVYEADFQWTAPAPGAGTVTLYSLLLAADGDGTEAGDQPNAGTPVVLREAGGSYVSELTKNLSITAYPNPVQNKLQLSFSNAASGVYTVKVYDMSGKALMSTNLELNANTSAYNLNTTDLKAGIYQIQIIGNNLLRTIPLIKN